MKDRSKNLGKAPMGGVPLTNTVIKTDPYGRVLAIEKLPKEKRPLNNFFGALLGLFGKRTI